MPVHARHLLGVAMVGDDGLHIDCKVTQLHASEKIDQTMQGFGNQDGSPRPRLHAAELIAKSEFFCHSTELLLEFDERNFGRGRESHALEEHRIVRVGVLLGVDDVAAD